jgi:hypothetical protein
MPCAIAIFMSGRQEAHASRLTCSIRNTQSRIRNIKLSSGARVPGMSHFPIKLTEDFILKFFSVPLCLCGDLPS